MLQNVRRSHTLWKANLVLVDPKSRCLPTATLGWQLLPTAMFEVPALQKAGNVVSHEQETALLGLATQQVSLCFAGMVLKD